MAKAGDLTIDLHVDTSEFMRQLHDFQAVLDKIDAGVAGINGKWPSANDLTKELTDDYWRRRKEAEAETDRLLNEGPGLHL